MYNYYDMKPKIFTQDGTHMLMTISKTVRDVIHCAGAFKLLSAFKKVSGDSWTMIACVDYLVESKFLKEINYGAPSGQDRIFVAGDKWSDFI